MREFLSKIFRRNAALRTDQYAYDRGYKDSELGRTVNPYTKGSVLHYSWEKGRKAQQDYELYVW